MDESVIVDRGDRYVETCFAFARTLLEMAEIAKSDGLGGVPKRHLLARLADQVPDADRAGWRVESDVLFRTIRRDLQAPVVDVFRESSHDGSGGIPRERRSLVLAPETMIQQIVLVDIDPSANRLLARIRDLSFTDQQPHYLPRPRVTHPLLNAHLNGDSMSDRDFFREAFADIRWLHQQGFIGGNYYMSDFRVRISFAGLVWLRDREWAMTEEITQGSATAGVSSSFNGARDFLESREDIGRGSFTAQVFPVMLAGPSDVVDEIQAARDAIDQWNAIHARDDHVVLVPMHWSRDASPGVGMPAQERIHDLLSDKASALIAIFHERIGTPTGDEVSGTASEINRFARKGKPVHVYFSEQPIKPRVAESSEFRRLREFEQELAGESLQARYESHDDLKTQLTKNVGMMGRDFIRGRRAILTGLITEPVEKPSVSQVADDLIVELSYRPDQEGYPTLHRATSDEVTASRVADTLRRRFQDDDMHRVDILLENSGKGVMRRFQQRWVPLGMLTASGHFEFGFVKAQPLPFTSVIRPGQSIQSRLWVSLMMLMSFGQTGAEQLSAKDGSWREMGILVHTWTDGSGYDYEDKQKLLIRSGGERSMELRLESTTDG